MMPNKILTLLFFVVSISYGFSQDYRHTTEGIDKVEVIASVSVIIKTHEAPSLLISSKENKQIERNTSGLTPIFGKDNTGFKVFVEQNNSTLKIESFQPRTDAPLIIYLPETIKLAVESREQNNIKISGFTNEIEAKTNQGDITIQNANGPVIIENEQGNTYVKFKELNQNSPNSIVNSHGDIYITIPSNTKATIEVSVPRGELYTDLELIAPENQDNKYRYRRDSRYIKSLLNGGGVSVVFIASRGNVYLRI
ncbi:MAG: hypothetical protein P1U56_23460 [Saprospiraceae bacterium]|nr:hypothetical protein [Saprospiraceae bacterium]